MYTRYRGSGGILEDQGVTWKMDIIVEIAEFWKIKESPGKWILSWNSGILEDQGITWKMDSVEIAEFWKIKESLGKWISWKKTELRRIRSRCSVLLRTGQ
jgi:hypothetical protein